MNCSRKETLQELVGDVSRYWVTEGTFGRIRARDEDAACEWSHDPGVTGHIQAVQLGEAWSSCSRPPSLL